MRGHHLGPAVRPFVDEAGVIVERWHGRSEDAHAALAAVTQALLALRAEGIGLREGDVRLSLRRSLYLAVLWALEARPDGTARWREERAFMGAVLSPLSARSDG